MQPTPQTRPLRTEIKQRRAALSAPQRERYSNQIVQQLLRLPQVRKARTVGIYLPTGSEVDVRSLAKSLSARLLVPVLHPFFPGRLWFTSWSTTAATRQNRYGIDEPVRPRPVPLIRVDVLIGPLLAFDNLGNRMGMGGGYYDRTLARMRSARSWHRPTYVCVAFDAQRVEYLKTNKWDVKPSYVVTERETFGTRHYRHT